MSEYFGSNTEFWKHRARLGMPALDSARFELVWQVLKNVVDVVTIAVPEASAVVSGPVTAQVVAAPQYEGTS